ncbi:MAG: hypothetical protein WCA20_33685 [Candidatus Sulfotelmatobacter sp.]
MNEGIGDCRFAAAERESTRFGQWYRDFDEAAGARGRYRVFGGGSLCGMIQDLDCR